MILARQSGSLSPQGSEKAPGNCGEDPKELMGLTFGGQIFSSFGESERKEIWERIKQFDGIIPSLETF
jgi:hypothetical protein